MKKLLLSASIVTAMGVTSVCLANSSSISITGYIVPGSCSISITDKADFGTINLSNLKDQGVDSKLYQLGSKSVGYSINCDKSTKVAMTLNADIQPSTEIAGASILDAGGYYKAIEKSASLGKIDGEDIGFYVFVPHRIYGSADGKNVANMVSEDGGDRWYSINHLSGTTFDLTGNNYYTWTLLGQPASVLSFENLSNRFSVSAGLNPDVVDKINDSVRFDASTTMTITYI